MKLSVLNTSVVVLARAHNPSILHPAFLAAEGIVPRDWVLAEQPVCTPAIALAKYANEVVFTVEPEKFQVMDNVPSTDSPIPDLATRYVEKLPHVHYTAVGINITGYVECPNPHRWILDRFMRPGPWHQAPLDPNAVGVRFSYPTDGAVLNLSCDTGTVYQRKEERQFDALLVNGNYHVAVIPDGALGATKQAIATYRERVAAFYRTAHVVLGLES